MSLRRIALGGFQSYREPQMLTIEPTITLLAGLNNTGKSALLRALRAFVEEQEGATTDFRLSYTWSYTADDLVSAAIPSGSSAPEVEQWLRERSAHTFSAAFLNTSDDSKVRPNSLFCNRIELAEAGAVAQGTPGSNLGWESGALGGSATGTDLLVAAAKAAASAVLYIAPRRIQQGARATPPQPLLQPDASNLAEVLLYLQLNHPTTTFSAVQDVLKEAFPDIQALTVYTDTLNQSYPPLGEPSVFYRHAPAQAVPLRLSGSGVEQMLSLVIGILTAPAPRIFLIDEPQAYLHPHAERSLLTLLDGHPQHQYIIATHSHFLLGARPLSQARLLTMAAGATRVTETLRRAEFLDELGVTAADIWLPEHLLWVEGPSEIGAFRPLLEELAPSQRAGLRVARMPAAASGFSTASSRKAEALFRFCDEVSFAVSPRPAPALFLFDRDEKTGEDVSSIEQASAGRARFLGVRELENLFLDVRVLLPAINEVRGAAEEPPLDSETVEGALGSALDAIEDRKLFPQRPSPGEELETIRGSEVLKRMWWDLATAPYDKPRNAEVLARLAFQHAPDLLDPLRELLSELFSSRGV